MINPHDTVSAVMALEGDEIDAREAALHMQGLINSGDGWRFQGSYGRAMMAAIEAGHNMLGTERGRDYYGNTIPARTDVQEGTKGSRAYVVAHMGEDWAAMLETLDKAAGPFSLVPERTSGPILRV